MEIIALNKKNRLDLLKRPMIKSEGLDDKLKIIFDDVLQNGNTAIQKYTSLFDNINSSDLLVSHEEIINSFDAVSEDLKRAIQLAKTNIEKFHKAQKTDTTEVETMKGVKCWQEKKPIEKVGLYIPGGTAALFSSVLMLAIPAQIAGCKQIILCSPPNQDGSLDPAILYTAHLCGVTTIFKVGGIQAIAGLTFGTESIPQVYKIFGPGNQYVTAAKQYATKFGMAIDMPAGPSELLVVADESAIPSYVAADLLSQAEHGIDSQVLLVSSSKKVLERTSIEVEKQLGKLPRREIVKKALSNSKFVLTENKEDALQFINLYAPEHFIICTENQDYFVDNIQNAGSVFIGNYTPESAGDYASGTNHTLPTNGFSKAYSGVNLDSFLKSITFQKITKDGLKAIGKSIEVMAEAEGLQAHKNAVSIRLNDLL